MVKPLNGGDLVSIVRMPLPSSGGSAPPDYSTGSSTGATFVSSALTGELFRMSHGATSIFGDGGVSAVSYADASVDDVSLRLAGIATFLSSSMAQLTSSAQVQGDCCAGMQASGSTHFVDAALKCLLDTGLELVPDPQPNSEMLHALGIHVMVNEQIAEGDGISALKMTVNALHIHLDAVLVTGLGEMSGDILLGHSEAALSCESGASAAPTVTPTPVVASTPTPTPLMGGLGITQLRMRLDGPSAARTGSLMVVGKIALPPFPLDVSGGVTLRVRDGDGNEEIAAWGAGQCRTLPSGITRCRSLDGARIFVFRALSSGEGIQFRMLLRRLEHTWLLRAPVTVTLIESIDATARAGAATTCTHSNRYMRCS